jgi:hypothetical protein
LVSQKLVNALEGIAPDVQVEGRSAPGTRSKIIEIKAVNLQTHVEYTPGTDQL